MRHAWKWLSRRSEDTSGLWGGIVISVFVFVQSLDGVLTFKGINSWGNVEANPIVGLIMSVFGIGPGLVITKLVAIGCGTFLYWKSARNAVILATAIYLIFAVFPWLYLFLTI